MRNLICLGVLVFGWTVMAGNLPVPPKAMTAEQRAEMLALKIRAGAAVKVKSYNSQSKTFDIQITKEPAVGPNTTNFEYLKRSMGEPTTARRLGNPQDWVGREMILVEDLKLLPDADPPTERPARKGKSRR